MTEEPKEGARPRLCLEIVRWWYQYW